MAVMFARLFLIVSLAMGGVMPAAGHTTVEGSLDCDGGSGCCQRKDERAPPECPGEERECSLRSACLGRCAPSQPVVITLCANPRASVVADPASLSGLGALYGHEVVPPFRPPRAASLPQS